MNEYTRYTTTHGQQLLHENSRSRIGYHPHHLGNGWEHQRSHPNSSPSAGHSRQQRQQRQQPVAYLSLVEPYAVRAGEDSDDDSLEEDSCCCWVSVILIVLLVGLVVTLGIILTREAPISPPPASRRADEMESSNQ
jgi:hypothetical protein